MQKQALLDKMAQEIHAARPRRFCTIRIAENGKILVTPDAESRPAWGPGLPTIILTMQNLSARVVALEARLARHEAREAEDRLTPNAKGT